MPGTLYNRWVELGEKGDFDTIVREYTEVHYRMGQKTATQEEWDDLEAFEEYMREAMPDNRWESKRGIHYIIGMVDAIMRYRAEQLVEIGRKAEEIEDKIKQGEIPGTELYRYDHKAASDLADQMAADMNGMGEKGSITATMVRLVTDEFTDMILPEELQSYEEGKEVIKLSDYSGSSKTNLEKGVGRVMREHFTNDMKLDLKEADRLRLRGEKMYYEANIEYGLKVNNDVYEPVEGKDTLDIAQKHYDKCGDKIQGYMDVLENMKEKAQKHLVRLTELSAYKRDNSPAFQNMLNALADVANLDTDKTPVQISEAMKKLEEASKAYEDRIKGSLFRGWSQNGRDRKALAEDLVQFAKDQNALFDKKNSGYLDPAKSIGEQDQKFREMAESLQNELDIREAEREAQKNAEKEISAEKETAKDVTVIHKPVSKAVTVIKETTSMETLMNEENAEKAKEEGKEKEAKGKAVGKAPQNKEKDHNAIREEVLRKREEIYKKRAENEKKGIPSDGRGFGK